MNEEKKSIYSPTIPYYKNKYSIDNVEIIGLMTGAGAKGDWDFRISDLVKKLMELMFNTCGEFR